MSATLTITRHPLARRGAAYTSLIKEMDRRGETALHKHEKEQLVDCADSLLFDEENADRKLGAARELLDGLVDSGRWNQDGAQIISELLQQIGEPTDSQDQDSSS